MCIRKNLYKWNSNSINLEFDYYKALFIGAVAIYTIEENLSGNMTLVTLADPRQNLGDPCQNSVLSNSLISANLTGENEVTTISFHFNFFLWMKFKHMKKHLRLYISFSVKFLLLFCPFFLWAFFLNHLLGCFTYVENWLFISVENIFSQFQCLHFAAMQKLCIHMRQNVLALESMASKLI